MAVTTSLDDPRHDFEVNARGTLNVLEGMRLQPAPPPLLFTSTNKVYGGLEALELRETASRYEPADGAIRARGIDERQPLDFESPYGCSKGAADQYVLDYGKTFGLKTVVFRMSCIYGPRQFGTEDQGWVAHFLLRALAHQPITLYGDGKQVRDVLFVDDLVRAMLLAQEHMDVAAGHAFNIGGGPERAVSLTELLERVNTLSGDAVEIVREAWRRGDQRYYVSDTRKAQALLGWRPVVGVDEGLGKLHRWIRSWLNEEAQAAASSREAFAG